MPPNTVEITVQAKTDLSKAHAEVKGFAGSIHSAMSVAEGIGIEKMVEKGIESVKDAILEFGKYGEEVRKIQKLTGETAEDSSHLLFAAHELGIEFDVVARGMGIFSKNMLVVQEGEAGFTDGINTTKKVLESLGITVTNTDGTLRPMKDLLLDLSTVFEKMPDGPTKTGLAMQLFGKGGTAMLPLLNQGAKGIEALNAEADKLGLTLSQKDVDAAHEFTMANRELNAAVKGLEISVGRELIPTVTQLAQAFTKGLESSENFTKFMKGAAFMLGAVWVDAMTLISNAIMSAFEAAINFIIHQINSLGDKIKVPDFVPGVGGSRVIPHINDATLGRSDLVDPMQGFHKLFPELGKDIHGVNDETKKVNPSLKDFKGNAKELAEAVKQSAALLKMLEKGELTLVEARKMGLAQDFSPPGQGEFAATKGGALLGHAEVVKQMNASDEAAWKYASTLSAVAEAYKENATAGMEYVASLDRETKSKLDAAAAELFGKGTQEQNRMQLYIDKLELAMSKATHAGGGGWTVETPQGKKAVESLQQAADVLKRLGVDIHNVPKGYDVIQGKGGAEAERLKAQIEEMQRRLRESQMNSRVREDTIKVNDKTVPTDAEQARMAKSLSSMMATTTTDLRNLSTATGKELLPSMQAAKESFYISRDAADVLSNKAFRDSLIPASFDVAKAYDAIVQAAASDVDAVNAHAAAVQAAADKINAIQINQPSPGPGPHIKPPNVGDGGQLPNANGFRPRLRGMGF